MSINPLEFFSSTNACLCIIHKVCHIAAERNDLSQIVMSIKSLGMYVVKMCSLYRQIVKTSD